MAFISTYCKKRTGQEQEHDRCYGNGKYLICECKCHKKEEA
jgi:hypothetical protein